jgi:hypothetical protein
MAKLVADKEMMVMGRVFDLFATLPPARRHAVHDYIGQRLDDMPTLAAVAEPDPEPEPEPVPMFPDIETRQRMRGGA